MGKTWGVGCWTPLEILVYWNFSKFGGPKAFQKYVRISHRRFAFEGPPYGGPRINPRLSRETRLSRKKHAVWG